MLLSVNMSSRQRKRTHEELSQSRARGLVIIAKREQEKERRAQRRADAQAKHVLTMQRLHMQQMRYERLNQSLALQASVLIASSQDTIETALAQITISDVQTPKTKKLKKNKSWWRRLLHRPTPRSKFDSIA